jgi:YbbR domain-containing protein
VKFRNFFVGNLTIKFSSILLAIVVWMMVHGEITTTRVFHKIPYQLELAPSRVVLKRDSKNLRITLAGPQDVMRDITEKSIQIVHNLKQIETPGAVQFSTSNSDFNLPHRTEVLDVQPKQINVVLDRLMEKELPVKVQFMGKPERGYQLRDFIVSPTITRVIGPQQKLESLTQIETQPILLTGRTRSFVQTVALKTLLSDERTSEAQYVDVYVKVDPELSKKTLENVPVSLLQQPGIGTTVEFEKATVQVTLEGSTDLIEKIRETDLTAYVDITDLKSGKYQLPVYIIPIPGVNFLKFSPQTVEVEITKETIS